MVDQPLPSREEPERSSSGPRRSVRRRAKLLDIDPAYEKLKPRTLWQRAQDDFRSGGTGLLISLVLHGIALVIMAIIVVQTNSSETLDPLVATWFTPPAAKPAEAAAPVVMRQPVRLPLNSALTPAPSEKSPPKPPANPSGGAPKLGLVPVQPVDIKRSLENRSLRTRQEELAKLGGSEDVERAIKAGLQWFVRQQRSDGRWELHQGYPDAAPSYVRTDTGATALALLPFLGAGQTHLEGDYQKVVAGGLEWLVKNQDPESGDLHDLRQEEGRLPAFYAHSMATIALCEALALTQDRNLLEPAEKAVRYLLFAQHPQLGGWKYRPIKEDMVGDLSVTSWALMALHSARMAGIEIDQEEYERASGFLDSVSEQGGSRYKYQPNSAAVAVTPALTAEGLLCRQWLGWPADDPRMKQGVNFLLLDRNRPEASTTGRVYSWYYTLQVLHNLGGDDWKTWNAAARQMVLKAQATSGSTKAGSDIRGSWKPEQPLSVGEEFGDKAGRLYLTSLCLLILETPFRHRPLYELAEQESTKSETRNPKGIPESKEGTGTIATP